MLSVDNLSLFKNHKKIFENIGFSIDLGSALVINGKNGSGKTSLLKVIAGISKQTSGKILWSDIDIDEMREDFNGDLQFIGHKNFLKQELTVVENLKFYASLQDTEILIPAALSFFALEGLANEKVKKLSAGWQKKVMLAKLLCCPATIWLLDEPSESLDNEAKERLCGLIETKIKDGKGLVIIATHDEIFNKFGMAVRMEDFG
ncbi:MAG: heme ABC exporter ATP-binding protein CcmA [Rickettsiales bacterium]|nr:heme ABC exporter ATP-binding protein CcmA [Rickettsiales bacterium]